MWIYGFGHKVNDRARVVRKDNESEGIRSEDSVEDNEREIQWRCAYGTHPFSSRTRRLRRKRPMVLCWRRHGRAGGCWIINREDPRGYLWGLSSVGRAPALQAGGREFESLSLQLQMLYLHNITVNITRKFLILKEFLWAYSSAG